MVRAPVRLPGGYPFLVNHRNMPLLPHRVVAPIRESLLSLATFCASVGAAIGDDRWTTAASALDAAAEALRDVCR